MNIIIASIANRIRKGQKYRSKAGGLEPAKSLELNTRPNI